MLVAKSSEPGLNYLCAGYKLFFKHIDPAMKMMANLLREGRWADEIMQLYAAQELKDGPISVNAGVERSLKPATAG